MMLMKTLGLKIESKSHITRAWESLRDFSNMLSTNTHSCIHVIHARDRYGPCLKRIPFIHWINSTTFSFVNWMFFFIHKIWKSKRKENTYCESDCSCRWLCWFWFPMVSNPHKNTLFPSTAYRTNSLMKLQQVLTAATESIDLYCWPKELSHTV